MVIKKTYIDGEPCDHPGSRNHISHPCENCGRVGAKGKAIVREFHNLKIDNKEKSDE